MTVILNNLVDTEKLKHLMREILAAEQEKATIIDDIKYKKSQMQAFLPRGGVPKAIKIYMSKGFDTFDIIDYKEISTILGIPFACEVFVPTEIDSKVEEMKGRDELITMLKSYATLEEEKRDLQTQIRDLYARAKAMGISVPLLKKAIDFCLHPDKLEAFRENCPLLESYVDVSQEL